MAAGALAVAAWRWPAAPPIPAPPDAPPAARAAEKVLPAWQARAPLGAPRGDLFAAPAAPPPAAAAAPRAPAEPVAPPLPYRVAGSIVREGVSNLLLARGDEVMPVEVGETLAGGYRVESIDATGITLLYLPLGVRERLPIDAAAAPPRVAQMRWQGPERVKAGMPFTVALHVTSEEPVRAPPLQVSFDAALLEPVAVRPGKLFGAEGFAYRVSADGSIFVGASGSKRSPVSVAVDDELVVFEFKALRPAAATELKLAPPSLQGAVGKPIALGRLGVYRAAIVP